MKDRFDDEIFVALFRKGAHAYLQNDLLSDMPKDTPTDLSDMGDKKIRKTIGRAIRREKNRRMARRLPRAMVIVLIVIAVCTGTMMSVEAFRTPFLNLFVNTEEKKTDIEIGEVQAGDEGGYWTDMFGYIPSGYELTSEDIQEQAAFFTFTKSQNDSIVVDRYLGEGSICIDTESADYGDTMINGHQAFYTIKDDFTTLVISQDGYAYMIYGSIDLEEIIKIAENIK